MSQKLREISLVVDRGPAANLRHRVGKSQTDPSRCNSFEPFNRSKLVTTVDYNSDEGLSQHFHSVQSSPAARSAKGSTHRMLQKPKSRAESLSRRMRPSTSPGLAWLPSCWLGSASSRAQRHDHDATAPQNDGKVTLYALVVLGAGEAGNTVLPI